MKVVINTRFGGFGLSSLGQLEYVRRSGMTFHAWDIDRTDAVLVQLVEEGGFNGNSSDLKVVEIPEGVDWGIAEYDGREWVAEKHRTWH
jgi:hypothetical protein